MRFPYVPTTSEENPKVIVNRTRTARLITASLGLLVASAVAGCGGAESPGTGAAATSAAATSAAAAAASHNDADVTFVQSMIPHHAGAIDMAALAADRASSPEVKELATAIEQAQEPEIEQMQGFLESWGVDESGDMTGMPGMSGGGMSDMSAMSEEQMQQLEQATGAAFDRMFLEMMIAHHTSAIDMAEQEVANGQNPDAKALAEKIIADQRAEIDRMQQLLTTV